VKRRELVLGIGLAAALVVGFVLTRDSGFGDAAETPVHLDLTESDGAFELGDLVVTVKAEPRPLRVFANLRFAFRFSTLAGEAVEITEPRIDFNMVMDMGPHGYRLVRDERGAWVAADVLLPQCGSGSRLWFGELAFEAEGRPHVARLRMELSPPKSD